MRGRGTGGLQAAVSGRLSPDVLLQNVVVLRRAQRALDPVRRKARQRDREPAGRGVQPPSAHVCSAEFWGQIWSREPQETACTADRLGEGCESSADRG